MNYFRFYFIPLGKILMLSLPSFSQRFPTVFSYLAKFLGNLDPQYESLFGGHDVNNEPIGKLDGNEREFPSNISICSDVKDLSQKILRYLKTAQRSIALPVGEVMLNRKERSYVFR